jgi:hypothetical protein
MFICTDGNDAEEGAQKQTRNGAKVHIIVQGKQREGVEWQCAEASVQGYRSNHALPLNVCMIDLMPPNRFEAPLGGVGGAARLAVAAAWFAMGIPIFVNFLALLLVASGAAMPRCVIVGAESVSVSASSLELMRLRDSSGSCIGVRARVVGWAYSGFRSGVSPADL